MSIFYSLHEWNGVRPPLFIWLANYVELMVDPNYWKVTANTALLIVYTLLFQAIPGLILAFLVYRTRRGLKFFRAASFVPVVVSPIAVGLMFLLFYNGDLGPLNKLLAGIGLPGLRHNWISDPKTVLRSVMFPQIWQYIGIHLVILLAALESIPVEILESATIDGASSLGIFSRIILPLLWDVIQICIILSVTGTLKSFDHAWAITKGGPGITSSFIAIYMYKEAFLNNRFGYGSAVVTTILIYGLVFTIFFKRYLSTERIQY